MENKTSKIFSLVVFLNLLISFSILYLLFVKINTQIEVSTSYGQNIESIENKSQIKTSYEWPINDSREPDICLISDTEADQINKANLGYGRTHDCWLTNQEIDIINRGTGEGYSGCWLNYTKAEKINSGEEGHQKIKGCWLTVGEAQNI